MLVRPGFEPTASHSADRRSPNWANQAADIAPSKLRALIEEARLSKAEETAKITAFLDRLTFSKQSGKQVGLRATIFGCLATEAEIAAVS